MAAGVSGVADEKPTEQPAAGQDEPAAETTASDGRVWMRLTGDDVPEDAEPVWFPDDPAVIEHYEARKFVRVDAPDTLVFVQRPNDTPPPDEEPWVWLVHEGIVGPARFPNNEAALQGAYDAGWSHPEQDAKDQPEQKPAKRTSKRASAEPADDQEG
jgi:hypothetical protein